MWEKNSYFYNVKTLEVIAREYKELREIGLLNGYGCPGIPQVVLTKADFDLALNSIGKGKWNGKIAKFKFYDNFGVQQRVIIADILHVPDYELKRLGFCHLPRLRKTAYKRLESFLNTFSASKWGRERILL